MKTAGSGSAADGAANGRRGDGLGEGRVRAGRSGPVAGVDHDIDRLELNHLPHRARHRAGGDQLAHAREVALLRRLGEQRAGVGWRLNLWLSLWDEAAAEVLARPRQSRRRQR